MEDGGCAGGQHLAPELDVGGHGHVGVSEWVDVGSGGEAGVVQAAGGGRRKHQVAFRSYGSDRAVRHRSPGQWRIRPLANQHSQRAKPTGDVQVIAHRDARATSPTTQCPRSIGTGMRADCVDIDVQMTNDGEPVVIPDMIEGEACDRPK